MTTNTKIQVFFCVFQNPEYNSAISDSVSLNDIKYRVFSYGRYKCITDFMDDLNIVFLNAKVFYSVSANNALIFFLHLLENHF